MWGNTSIMLLTSVPVVCKALFVEMTVAQLKISILNALTTEC